MKLSEAIGMVEKNYKLRFRSNRRKHDKSYSELSCSEYGYIYITNYKANGEKEEGERIEFNGMICNEMNWELIEEPMYFKELLKVKNIQNKSIRVEYKGIKTCYDSFRYTMKYLSDICKNEEIIEIIKHGSWYVKENK